MSRLSAPAACDRPDPGISAQEIRVGGIFPTTGPDGQFFEAVGKGIQARFAVENNRGGVGGRKLTLVSADDGDGELANLAVARRLVEQDRVFGVIEAGISGDGSGAYLHQNGVPVTGWGITRAWGAYNNMFGYRYSTSPKPGGEPVTRQAAFIKAHGGHRVAVIAGGSAASVNVAEQVAATLPALGLSLAYKADHVSTGTVDWTTDVQQIKKSGADALYTGMSTPSNIGLLEAAALAGLHFNVVLLPEGYDARLAAAAPAAVDGAYLAIDWRPFELPLPAHAAFKDALKQVAPNEFPSQLAMVGWLSADAFVRGLREAGEGCPTRRAFVNNLRMVKDYTADGLLPPTDFAQLFGKMPLCFYYVQLAGHHFTPIGDQPFCGVRLRAYKA